MASLTEAQIFKELCENDFSFYVKHYLKVVEPETEFDWNWHMDALCYACELVYYGEIQNIDINIPPRLLKSIIITVLFPTWIWAKNPSKKIIAASSNYDLAVKFNHKRRDIITSKEYQSLWPIHIRSDYNMVNVFMNLNGGFMRAASAGGKITGDGADFLLSDDLLDAMDAFSKAKREATNLWYSNVFYNRAQNKKTVKRLNINQRLHLNDVSGHIRTNHNFERLILPMIKTDKNDSTVDFVDPRKEGEFLFPLRYGEKEYQDDYKAMGVYGYSSQYQQTPRPIGGGIVKEEWIRYYNPKDVSNFDKKIIVADLSFKGSKKSDYVCFQCWGRSNGKRYLIDIIRGKWSYKETKEKFKIFCEKNNAYNKYIEDKANGPAMISDLSGEIPGIKAWPSTGSKYMNIDKVQRLHLVSQDYENGLVYFPEGIVLVGEFVDELTSFTEKGSATGNDDMVDTSTMGLLELNKANTFAEG